VVKGRVSIIIPARNEPHLTQTVHGLLSQSRGDVEILVMLDGGVPEVSPLPDDPRVRVFRRTVDATHEAGMRFCINEGAEVATGEYLMKCDAHCIFAEGYDDALKADCDEDWLVVPTRHSVEYERWTVKLRHYNYHILTFPYLPSMYGEGLHAVTFDWHLNKQINADYAHTPIDDLMSFQGSCWFQKTANFHRLGPLDHANYYFYQEAQEVGLRQWMTGGRCVINKKTWYAHLHKGKEQGRGFYLSLNRKRQSERFAADFWLNDRQPGATRTFVSLVEQFWPLLSRMKDPKYAWPADWRDFAAHKQQFENRPPEAIPAHL
jgi:glycosyltransferase involved in cell wall biosynthesis